MSNVTIVPGVDFDPSQFWTEDGSGITNQGLDDLLSQVSNLDVLGLGDIISNFKELVFQVGDLTYHYIGDWTNTLTKGLLSSSSATEGSYNQIVVEKDGEQVASLQLDQPLDVDLGGVTGLANDTVGSLVDTLLGLGVGDALDPVLEPLLGDSLEGTLDNLHLDATPDLLGLVDDILGGGTDPTDGDDDLTGTDAGDTIDAMGGDDLIHSGGGDDTVHGGDGNDQIWGEAGNDKLYGDAGNDKLYGGPGRDLLHGGAGNDMIWGHGANDGLYGDAGTDIIRGSGSVDREFGGGGADKLYGGSGGDKLTGGAGGDVITGGAGHDVLTGGKGADVFDFNKRGESTINRSGRDEITDFHRSQGDKIDLSSIDADPSAAGNQDFVFVGRHRFDADASELRFVRQNGHTTVQADTNGDGKADFSIQLDHAINLHASDFIL